MNIAILEKANLPDAPVSSGLVMATFEANDPLVVNQPLIEGWIFFKAAFSRKVQTLATPQNSLD